jgi:hypothetical protein
MPDLQKAHDKLIDFLTSTYTHDLLQRKGATYPVTIFTPTPEQQNDPDSILSVDYPSEFSDPATFAFYDSDHLNNLLTTRPGQTNGITYDMHSIATNPLKVEACLGHFFDGLATSDALDHELRDFAQGKRNDLPHREKLHGVVSKDEVIANGAGRSAIIGAAMLTVFNHNGAYRAIFVRRSKNLATGAGLYHIAPAFVFQPVGPQSYHPQEWSMKHQCMREYAEELFAMPEFADWHNPGSARYFYQHPAILDLRAMLDDGRAALYLTGIAVNFLSARPEICTLLIIHDENWYTRSEQKLKAALFTERQETHYIPINTLQGLPDNLHTSMAPQGAAAFWLGIDKARAEIG